GAGGGGVGGQHGGGFGCDGHGDVGRFQRDDAQDGVVAGLEVLTDRHVVQGNSRCGDVDGECGVAVIGCGVAGGLGEGDGGGAGGGGVELGGGAVAVVAGEGEGFLGEGAHGGVGVGEVDGGAGAGA